MERSLRIIVSGRVQGVGYQASCAREATALGLRGTVRNLGDGGVEVFVTGTEPLVDELVAWCRNGPPWAAVSSVEVSAVDELAPVTGFKVVR